MLKISIVPEIINSEKIQIWDNNNVPVVICPSSRFLFNYNLFREPFVLIDEIERMRYKEIEIKKIEINALSNLNLRLVSFRTSKSRNYVGQKNSYALEVIGNPIPNSIVMSHIPKNHELEMDIINNPF